MMTLPTFEMLKSQPKIPGTARVCAQKIVPNEYGTPILFKVYRSRTGTDWWCLAVLNGMRMSNTLHTTVEAKAEAWISAVNAGQICCAPAL